jgi:tRNA1Val (adenine37-N6)-methyltransferase
MTDYAQPEFYHFSEDSLALVNYVASMERDASHILDLGSGSGIIGIELANKLTPQSLTLLEVQEEFMPHLNTNISNLLKKNIEAFVFQDSFSRWVPFLNYDLVVCNPPYFLPGHGVSSPDTRKQACRTFVIDDWDSLLRLTERCLSDKGRAYFVVRNDDRILSAFKGYRRTLGLEIRSYKRLSFLKLSRLNVD